MDNQNLKLLTGLIGDSYTNIAIRSRNTFSKKLRILLEHKKIPKLGFSDNEIEIILKEFSNMDANNFDSFTGIGEREGRVFSTLVRNRHFNLSHGIGRSGDVSSLQPKAVGSSLINKLTNSLVLHLFHEMGMKSIKKALVVPMATGMTLTLAMLSLKSERPNAKYVIWPRIDQKACFKSIKTAGLEPIIIEMVAVGDELQTDTCTIEKAITSYGHENILCILTTTSCFAPRVPDDIVKVSKICAENEVPHVINNAYGVTLKRCMNVINDAICKYGRSGVYAVVQSTDKNLLVPVGGAIIVSCDESIVNKLSETYTGRASITPSLDVLITLLSMGLDKFHKLVEVRESQFEYLKTRLSEIAHSFNLRLMNTPHNPISLALALPSNGKSVTEIGSQLFHRSISGARVVQSAESNKKVTVIDGQAFIGFGSHSSTSTCDYINAAAAIGQTKSEIDRFIDIFETVLKKYYNDQSTGDGDL